jgi:CheY-like chemotaxis protein
MGHTVFVVEDDATVLRLVSVTLRAYGYDAITSSNAEGALEKLPDEMPDVIICDVQLPGMNGAQFTDLVKAAPLLTDTPVILMSAHDEPQQHAAQAFVSKPFDSLEMVRLVEELASALPGSTR